MGELDAAVSGADVYAGPKRHVGMLRSQFWGSSLCFSKEEEKMGNLRIRHGFLLGFFLCLMLAGRAAVAVPAFAAVQTEKSVQESTAKKEKKGWHQVLEDGVKKYYYVNAKGERLTGCWFEWKNKTFYLSKKTGYCATGIVKISGKRYYFSARGVRKTGWKTRKGKTYYFLKKSGEAATGLKKIGKSRYLFSKRGVMLFGWQTWEGNTYYLNEKGRALKGLQTIDGRQYYFSSEGKMITGLVQIGDDVAYFNKEDGHRLFSGFTPGGRYVHSDGKVIRKSTIRNLLKTALGPVGTTLYVWGGGWNTDPNGQASGIDAVTIGVPARWKEFFYSYGAGYDYRQTRYQTRDGLDCSGYVGWVLYNTFNTKSGNDGYVMLAQNMASTYASWGWGSYALAGSFSDFQAGDIMSLSSGHVYITVGQCSDGSVVLLHASPPGVMITGTSTPSGSQLSQANALASKYMKKYFPDYYNRYSGKLSRGTSYLNSYSRMRWYLSGKCVMTDPDGFTGKSAEKILKKLLGSV